MATTDEAPGKTDGTAVAESVAWYALSPAAAADRLDVSPEEGLSGAEASSRLGSYGPNKFAVAEVEPRWHAFVRQYRDPMQIVLLVAGIGSLYPLKELGTGLVLIVLTLFNAVLGLRQEGKAAEAVAALQKMMIVKARVRRDGELVELPAEELVPGDVVSIEAGDVVPADGRLLSAATLEIAEAALTGESMPVAKSIDAVESAATPRSFHAAISNSKQSMTRREALASMTLWAAYANFQDRVIGSITPGKYADFVIVDRDWMSVPAEAIPETNVLATYFGGRCVYGSA